MAKQFRFPDVGEGITEGEIVRWLVKEGDEVKADQALAEVETDKAIVEMPSPYSGTILKLHFKEKDIVKVGQVLVTVGEKGEAVPEAGVPAEKVAALQTGAAPASVAAAAPASASAAAPLGGPAQATPKVRKFAQELGIALATIQGTGPGGRITEDDVRSAKEKPAEKKLEIKVKAKYDLYGNVERIPLRGVRRATARHMRESLDKAAHVTHCDEAEAAKLAALREKMKAEAEARGIKLSYLPFVVKAVIEALKLHPTLNSMLNEEAEEIIVRKYYNIGIAVDIPDGLIVPVLKMADQKSVLEIAEEIQNLARAARERALDLADLKGGTFSITNVGVIGGTAATPIINYPEVAILATMKIDDRARVENGVVVVKKTLPLCLSFDHRVIDGAEAARFMKDLIRFLEEPEKLPLAGE
ncbi:MAG: dihydrolipoamide acetyltransferase family protein [Candidatus Aminicenantales bacterium]|jgi:pyruvate dehydrogenase E2 component (dihydrolipoamide acetyltransferase)